MKITVTRRFSTLFSVIGEMTIDSDPDFHAFTLEPPYRNDGKKPRAIPAGTYKVTLRFSPKHHGDVPHVENVPGFQEIEIHIGNYPKDTEGCTLVGQTFPQVDFIGASGPKFFELLGKVKQAVENKEDMSITYVDDVPAKVFRIS